MARNQSAEKCPCCNEVLNPSMAGIRQTYRNVDFAANSIFNDLVILSCTNCEFSFVSNPPSNLELREFYEFVYRSNSSAYKIDFADLKSIPIDFRALSQLALATNFTNFKSGDIFLDLGAGNGNSFQMAKKILIEPDLVSVESSSSASQYYSKRFNVKTYSEIEEFRKKGDLAKIILLSHSLEHFRFDDVTSLLTQISGLLTKDGVCVIEVPNANLLRDRDFFINDSPHLLFFTPESLGLLLRKANLKILATQIVGQPIDLHQIAKKNPKTLSSRMVLKILGRLQRYLDSSLLTIDTSPGGPFFSNFTQNEKGDVIRVVVSRKRMD